MNMFDIEELRTDVESIPVDADALETLGSIDPALARELADFALDGMEEDE